MTHHDLARSTHTPELHQIRELNERLADGTVTAADLGLADRPVERLRGTAGSGATATAPAPGTGGTPSALPAAAALAHLSAEGPPDFPYIEGHFTVAGGGTQLAVTLHTDTLRRLSQRFGLHHIWGA